jgi:beta-N-acetylhexosaminidase
MTGSPVLAAPPLHSPASGQGTAVVAKHADRSYVARTVARMSLEEKVGQLFVTNVYGSQAGTVTEAEGIANMAAYGVATPAEVVAKYHLGGVIYFAWTNSVQNPAQITALSNGLQETALHSGARVPLIVAIDQEQGVVTRIGPPATQFPGNMALGAGRSTDDTRTAARITGRELRAMGINQNFAPDADVNVNPANPVIGVRSFSSEPALAATLTDAAVRGYQVDANIAATAKHFPGHGDTAVDSHFGIPLITHTLAQWQTLDAPPFQAAIAAGVDSIMTAHIVVPSLDPSGMPATLSKPIVTGVLRGELGFDGVVYTDALTMQGVRDAYTDAQIPVLALAAGVDVLLMPAEGAMDAAYQGVLAAVRSGQLKEKRIDQSVRRILTLKLERGIVAHPKADPAALPAVVGTAQHLAQAQAITDRTTTLVTNDGTLPLAATGRKVLVVGYDAATTSALTTSLTSRGAIVSTTISTTSPDVTMRTNVVAEATVNDVVVVLTNNMSAQTDAAANVRALVADLATIGTPLIAAALRNPYDVAYGAGVESWIATYSFKPIAIESLARTITGEVQPHGTLPVDVPAAGDGTTAYPFGHGLSW